MCTSLKIAQQRLTCSLEIAEVSCTNSIVLVSNTRADPALANEIKLLHEEHAKCSPFLHISELMF